MDPFDAIGASLQPLEGGFSGETFLARVGGGSSVVRIFAAPHHGPHAAEVQESVLRLVRGLVPAPRVLELRRADAAVGMPAMLVTEHLPGVRGDLLLADLRAAGRTDALAVVGRALGTVAATLSGMPQLRRGRLVDGELRVEPRPDDLEDQIARHAGGLAARGWSSDALDALAGVAGDAQDRLDAVERTALVHGDLVPDNVLVDPATLAVTGVVDWERAHAGHPFADLGSLLRLDRDPSWVTGVLAAWQGRLGTDPAEALDLARCADLAALVELATEDGDDPAAGTADRLLRAIAASGDVHAVPD
ncbi:phosphotransferase family protein [Nocardioides ochotonae]|uniref:phosphotransferase family protein n=1 Tax=Nocardioides ochotonae TaxID=2685869 RepID=UPI0014093DD9|nr:phosphotransferase [Nocardioides ochotonae]